MITSKERAQLRAKANSIEPILWIGKGGITDTLTKQADDALTARELVKLKLLETAPCSAKESASALADATGSDVVQVIGRTVVLYKYNPKLHEKVKPKKAPKPREYYWKNYGDRYRENEMKRGGRPYGFKDGNKRSFSDRKDGFRKSEFRGKPEFRGKADYKGKSEYRGKSDYKGNSDYKGKSEYRVKPEYRGKTEYKGKSVYRGNSGSYGKKRP